MKPEQNGVVGVRAHVSGVDDRGSEGRGRQTNDNRTTDLKQRH